MQSSTSVLIVGGSLNGLTLAMLLARRRVPCLVVERHPRTSIQYKFRGISARSMEIYRSAGIEAAAAPSSSDSRPTSTPMPVGPYILCAENA